MEVAWSLRVLKGVERTWEVGGCGHWRAAETGFGLGLAKRARSSKSPRSFLFFLPSHIYALLALQLALRPPSSFRRVFLSCHPSCPTDGTSSWQPEVEEAAPDRYLALFGSPLTPWGWKKGRASFAVRNRRRRQPRHETQRSKLRAITLTRRDGLKSRTAEHGGTVTNSRGLRSSEETCIERGRRKNAFLSAMWCDVFLLREILFSNAIPERSIPEGTRDTEISRWRHAKSIFHILDNWKLYPFYIGYIENVIFIYNL